MKNKGKKGSQLFILVVAFLGLKTKQDSSREKKKKKRGTGLLLFPNFSKFSSYGELGCSLWTRAKHVPTHSLTNLSVRGLLAQHHLVWSQREICDSISCRHVSCLTPQETILCTEGRIGKSYFQFTASLQHAVLPHFMNKNYPKACGELGHPGNGAKQRPQVTRKDFRGCCCQYVHPLQEAGEPVATTSAQMM